MLINSETIATATTKQLREMAKQLGVKYASKKGKAELQAELKQAWEEQLFSDCEVCGDAGHSTAEHTDPLDEVPNVEEDDPEEYVRAGHDSAAYRNDELAAAIAEDADEVEDLIGGVVDSEAALMDNFSAEEQLVIRVAQHLGLTLAADFEFPGKGKAIKTVEGNTIYLNSLKKAEVKATSRDQAIVWEQDAMGTRTKPMYITVDVTSL